MKLHMIWVVGLVLSATGCGEKEQVMSEPMDEASMSTPEAAALTAEHEIWQNESFREHMHLHADNLDNLYFALADGDLDAAQESANWLATHDTNSDVQSAWLPYLYSMRTAAEAVEAAPDIATAQTAAEQITAHCQQCHTAVGVSPL